MTIAPILKIIPLILLGIFVSSCHSTQSDEEKVHKAMEQWKAAVLGQDMDAILECYSENFETWKKMNHCSGTYHVTWSSGESVAWTYQDCENGSEVCLVTIDGGRHVLYKGEGTEINTTQLAWNFMKRFSK